MILCLAYGWSQSTTQYHQVQALWTRKNDFFLCGITIICPISLLTCDVWDIVISSLYKLIIVNTFYLHIYIFNNKSFAVATFWFYLLFLFVVSTTKLCNVQSLILLSKIIRLLPLWCCACWMFVCLNTNTKWGHLQGIVRTLWVLYQPTFLQMIIVHNKDVIWKVDTSYVSTTTLKR